MLVGSAGGPSELTKFDPWSMPLLLLQSTLNTLGETPMSKDERWVVLDACIVITLVSTGNTVSVILLLKGDSS